MGVPVAPRTEVVRKLWAYIKQHELQTLEDKRTIKPDQTLASLFGTSQFSMFAMNKRLNEHILAPATPAEDSHPETHEQRNATDSPPGREASEAKGEDGSQAVYTKGSSSAFLNYPSQQRPVSAHDPWGTPHSRA